MALKFIAQTLKDQAGEDNTIQAFIPPNGYVESFHNRMRDELLKDNCIEDSHHTQLLVLQWSELYNNYHPHSSLGNISPNEYTKQHKENTLINS